MRALSLTQPWATLAAIGAKTIETRSWPTYYRGPLLIHASKGFPGWARDVCLRPRFQMALGRAGYCGAPAELTVGAIIGIVTLVGCVSTSQALEMASDTEKEFGDYGPGRFAWQLSEALRFDEPIPCKGALGLWKVPDEIARALELRLGERVS
jgi:hypothetical protein